MLRKLGGKKPHTVRLLATFRCDETYCLLFPWAECDLLAYWNREEGLQKPDIDLIQWVSVQCHGLMSAINWIHDPKVLGQDNLELFGRHGDIKPENILWYKTSSPSANPLASGELSISDFGLSALNHKNTRSNIQNGSILHTTTYAPPESVLANHVISRAIDIWALGCVCLEFTTWLVGGPSRVGEFKSKRMSRFLGHPVVQNDVFWELQTVGNSGTVEVLKPEVVEVRACGESFHSTPKRRVITNTAHITQWIKSLWNRPEATKYIRDFLDIITKHMLVTERGGRSDAQHLVSEFRSLVDRDAAYYTVPLGRGNKVIEVIQPPSIEKLSPNVQNVIQQSFSSGGSLQQFSGQSRPTSTGE
jgi:serine/threonine protein kinase